MLGFEHVKTTNLFTEATPTVVELNRNTGFAPWSVTQDEIEALLCGVGGVLAAWGVSGASGRLRREREKRGAWLLARAAAYGHTSVWMVGGEPRHPSRWHQYVADKHQRTLGGTPGERLAQVLVAVSVTDAVAAGDHTLDLGSMWQ